MPNIIDQILFRLGGNNLRVALARKWGLNLGKNCILYPPCTFTEPYLVSIGDDCVITSGVSFLTHDRAPRIFKKNKDFLESIHGPITIKKNCFIGINSIILPNVTIGPNSVVGAGSVVTKNVPPNTVYAGNPADHICTYDEFLEKCKRNNTGMINRKEKKEKLLELFKNQLK